jgi:hypothetical protein
MSSIRELLRGFKRGFDEGGEGLSVWGVAKTLLAAAFVALVVYDLAHRYWG